MNQKEELLERARVALAVPAAVSFIKSLQVLAPDNIPGLAKELRDKAGLGQVWEKSIVDLARLARDFPGEFLAAVWEEDMKKSASAVRRFTLTPEFIRFGYATVVNLAGFECGLRVRPIGTGRDSFNDLLGRKIETPKKDSYAFTPYFDVELFPPPLSSKDELNAIISHFGPWHFPGQRRYDFVIDGHKLTIHHSFHKEEESPYPFFDWVTGSWWRKDERVWPWEAELDNFCFIFRLEIDFPGMGKHPNWIIPEYFKSRDFRLKIVLHCLHEYFGLPVKV